LAARLIAIPLIGVVAGLLYYGLHDRFFLPECDSDRAERTLADVLKQLKLEPSRYAPVTTVSAAKRKSCARRPCHCPMVAMSRSITVFTGRAAKPTSDIR
jgi:hypothetical protein